MVKTSTLLYIYNEFVSENELINPEDLIFTGEYLDDELGKIFGNFEKNPSNEVVQKILQKA